MAPSNLQGLNIVQPEPPSNPYVSDADLLAQLPPFADFNAQLDLWTDLSFQSDEPIVPKNSKGGAEGTKYGGDDSDKYEEEEGDTSVDEKNGRTVSPNSAAPATIHGSAPQAPSNLDVAQILAGFGLTGLGVPPPPTGATATGVPSLAQLLTLYGQSAAPFPAQPFLASPSVSPPATQTTQSQLPVAEPATKRARTRKISTATITSETAESPLPDTSTPLTAAEDKRRRNTAASARFRLKKKEREQALERKAKELEVRVTELERECEGLRRENGWLKGLVVGVTGAQQKQKASSSPVVSAGSKRTREEGEDASP